MKKNIIRVLALLAAVTMTGTTMTGCGGKKKTPSSSSESSASGVSSGDTSSGSSSDTQTSATGTSSQSSSQSSSSKSGSQSVSQSGSGSQQSSSGSKTFKEPVYDLGGRVIKIAWENADPATQTGSQYDSILMNSLKETEKKYNCTFKFVQKTDYVGLYNNVTLDYTAGKATYDAYILRGYDVMPNLANTGAILKMDTLYDFANDPTWQKTQVKGMGYFKGHKYGLVYEPNSYGVGIWYNRALLAQAGIPDLWTYVNNNTWTFDTFRKVCKQFETKMGDPNGDGTRENYAFTSEDPWLTFVATNNASLFKLDANGKATFALDSQNAMYMLDQIQQMHNTDHSIPNGTELGKITNKPFNAMFTGKVAMFTYTSLYGAVLKQQHINDIGFVYMPKGPAASGYVAPTGTMPNMAVFPTKLKDADKVIAAVQDGLSYWNTSKAKPVAIEAKTEWLYNSIKDSMPGDAYKVLKLQALNPVFTWANNYGLEDLQNQLWPKILQTQNVKSSIDSLKGTLQAKIDQKYSGNVVG